ELPALDGPPKRQRWPRLCQACSVDIYRPRLTLALGTPSETVYDQDLDKKTATSAELTSAKG
ncbi:hypothetical protein N9Q31_06480, partial [Pseudomonadales bacterium]|nr:hypothetical protein [Pseudomonadales bacterium]